MSKDSWIDKETMVHMLNVILLGQKKKIKIKKFSSMWMDLQSMLREISQKERYTDTEW